MDERNRVCRRHFRHNSMGDSLRVVNSAGRANAFVGFGTSPRVFARAARCSFRALRGELERRTFLGTKLSVSLASGHSRSGVLDRMCYCRNNVHDFISCVGGDHKLAPLRRSVVRFSIISNSHDTRITVSCGSNCGRVVLDFTGSIHAVSNNARRVNFGATLAEIFGSCNGGFGLVGSDSGGLSNSSMERNLATIVDMGLARTRFRNRAGNGLKGARVANLISGVLCSGLVACLRRGPSATEAVLGGSLSTSETHRTTEGTESGTHEGSTLRDGSLPNGLTSYASGGPRGARLCVIRKSSTNNSTGKKESEGARTVLPL